MVGLQIKDAPFGSSGTPDPINKKVLEPLPKLPFRLLIVAPSFGGKTTLILNLLKFYENVFKKSDLFLVSQTAFTDPSWKKAPIPVDNRIDSYDEAWLQDICGLNEEFGSSSTSTSRFKTNKFAKLFGIDESRTSVTKPKPHKLVIFDDVIGSGFSKRNGNTFLDSFITRCRHHKVSVIISTQKYKVVSSTIRINVSAIILFRIGNVTERKVIAEEQSDGVSPQQFLEMWANAVKPSRGFLFIRKDLPPNLGMFRNGFSEEYIL